MKKKLFIGLLILVIISTAAFAILKYLARDRTTREIERFVSKISVIERFGYERLDVSLFDRGFTLGRVSLLPAGFNQAIHIEKVVVRELKMKDDVLLGLDLKIDEIRIYSSEILPASFLENNRGFPNEIRLFSGVSYSYDPVEKRLDMESMTVQSPDIGRLNFQFKLTNIDMNNIHPENPMASIPALFGVLIHDAVIQYEDFSFLDYLKESGYFQDVIRKAIHAVEKEMRRETDPETKKTLVGVKAFLENPDRVQIRMYPEQAVPVGRLLWIRSPGELIRVLSIRVEKSR